MPAFLDGFCPVAGVLASLDDGLVFKEDICVFGPLVGVLADLFDDHDPICLFDARQLGIFAGVDSESCSYLVDRGVIDLRWESAIAHPVEGRCPVQRI